MIDEATTDTDDEPDAPGNPFGRPARIPLRDLFSFLTPGNSGSSTQGDSARTYMDQLWREAVVSNDSDLELAGILEEVGVSEPETD
ncbi:hypothetical protein FRC11_010912 [Ceratobasidium sp. 423]|nr:hypothetical protein FRC11_010912 [Ceratobasidium sp. 423]